ncbi:MAG: hypothetical protein JXR07_04700 [Reichenbachiella sp.]
MRFLITTIALLLTVNCHAQVGKVFPDMKAETLTNKSVDIPQDLNDKFSLICLASSPKAEDYLGRWFSPIYNNFIYKPETPDLFSFHYDIHVYFVPMITGAKKVAYKTTMKKTQESADPLMKPHILFYEGSLSDYKKQLEMKEKNLPHFFVLDLSGKIVYKTSGLYSDKKMQEIINEVGSAMKH